MSSCDCIYIDPTDWERPACFFESRPTARKKHTCTECGRVINIGEKYTNEAGKWDGEFRTYKTCEDCLSIRNEMFCKTWIFAQIWDDVQSYLWDMNYEISEDCLLALTPRAREMVIDLMSDLISEG